MLQHLILVVKDEPSMQEMMRYTPKRIKGIVKFVIIEAENTCEAGLAIAKQPYVLILLDWMLAEISGVKTAKAEGNCKIKGLGINTDGHITKSFSPRELIARIKAVLRRSSFISADGNISLGPITLQIEKRVLLTKNKETVLTPIAFKCIFGNKTTVKAA